MRKDDSEKSIVGDPVFWPGLIYAPINVSGLLFALGSISNMTGLIFEEFSESGRTAICRRRTGQGWERIKVALVIRSSEYDSTRDDIDLVVCWIDDSRDSNLPLVMELSTMESAGVLRTGKEVGNIEKPDREISREISVEDHEDAEYGEFEDTIRQLDEKIRKFKGGR